MPFPIVPVLIGLAAAAYYALSGKPKPPPGPVGPITPPTPDKLTPTFQLVKAQDGPAIWTMTPPAAKLLVSNVLPGKQLDKAGQVGAGPTLIEILRASVNPPSAIGTGATADTLIQQFAATGNWIVIDKKLYDEKGWAYFFVTPKASLAFNYAQAANGQWAIVGPPSPPGTFPAWPSWPPTYYWATVNEASTDAGLRAGSGAAAPPPQPPPQHTYPVSVPPAPAPAPVFAPGRTYTVRKGDIASKIIGKIHPPFTRGKLAELAAANGGQDMGRIFEGQALKIPANWP